MRSDRNDPSGFRAWPVWAVLLTLILGLVPVARGLAAGLATVSFGAPISSDLAGPGAGRALLGADFDLDCDLDFVTTRDETVATETASAIVRLGDALGSFPDGGTLDAGQGLSDAASADFNRDGIPDLVTVENFETTGGPTALCQSATPRIPVFLGDGLGGFSHSACLAASDHPSSVVAADFTHDGSIDLLVVNAVTSVSGVTSSDVVFFQGLGNGLFSTGVTVFNRRGFDVEAADFNGDNHLDVVIASDSGSFVHLGAGDGTFAASVTGALTAAKRVAVGDVNADGAPDIITVSSDYFNNSDDVVRVALNLNDGSGAFGPSASFPTGSHPVDVRAADLDLDGRDDVVTANNLGDSVSVFLSLTDGTLQSQGTFAAGLDPSALALADVNKDGFPDIRRLQPESGRAERAGGRHPVSASAGSDRASRYRHPDAA